MYIVEFDEEDNKPAVTVSVKELDIRCEEPDLGNTGFRFEGKYILIGMSS